MQIFRKHSILSINTTVRLLILALSCATLAIHAEEYQNVNQLMAAGKLGEAMNKADAFLSTKPADLQMRFLKGVLQRNASKQTEAIATFIKLTEDYPALSKPYNNLAVIYAGQSQFDKARAALEMAIRTNPSYATAYENLCDVYVRLAGQTYSKALELDIGNTTILSKLALIREVAKPSAKSPTAVVVNPVVIAAVAIPAKAWSSQDLATYLAAYAKEFSPSGTQSHPAWAKERTARISKKSGVSVSVENLIIKFTANQAVATFRQGYRSGVLNESSPKTLELSMVGDQWLIIKENTVK
jgi:tetratricopeptide (TPR) repeat protein